MGGFRRSLGGRNRIAGALDLGQRGQPPRWDRDGGIFPKERRILSPSFNGRLIGLARERRVSPLAILKMQPAFLAALSFNTEWARQRFPACLIPAKIAEAERLLALLEGGNL